MRTTRDAMRKKWLQCPETKEAVNIGHSFTDCSYDHGCADRAPSDCPLYVERVIRRTVMARPRRAAG